MMSWSLPMAGMARLKPSPRGATGARKVFLASGTSFPDALAATPAAAINNGPILLTRGTCTPKVTQSTRTVLKPALTVYLGHKLSSRKA